MQILLSRVYANNERLTNAESSRHPYVFGMACVVFFNKYSNFEICHTLKSINHGRAEQYFMYMNNFPFPYNAKRNKLLNANGKNLLKESIH